MALLTNIALLGLASFLLLVFLDRYDIDKQKVESATAIGIICGLLAAVLVSLPLRIELGATFDTRAGPAVLSGLFGGPLAAIITACIGGYARYSVGGAAAIGGVASFGLYGAAGTLFWWLMKRYGISRVSAMHLMLLTLASTIMVLPSFFIGQPIVTGAKILSTAWQNLLIGNLFGILLLGLSVNAVREIVRKKHDLKKAEILTTLAHESATVGIFKFELTTGKISLDSIHSQMILGEYKEHIITLKTFLSRIIPADRKIMVELLRHGDPAQGTQSIRYRTAGTENSRVILTTLTLVGDWEQPGKAIVGVSVDQTAEDMLRRDLAVKSFALESASNGIIIAEAGGDMPIVYANAAFEQISGYSRPEVIGTNCRFLTRGAEATRERAIIREALANGQSCDVTIRNVRKNGELFWNHISLSPIRDSADKLTHYVGIQEDVSATISAMEEVKTAKNNLEVILASVPDAIIIVGADQRIRSFNRAAERLFAWSEEDIRGRPLDTIIPADERIGHDKLAGSYLQDTGAQPRPMLARRHVEGLRKNGETFPMMVSLGRFVQDGMPAVAAIAHDISDLMIANEKLQDMAGQLTQQLHLANEASEAKTNFLANMSHELRTPLNAIIGYADMMATLGVPNLKPEKVEEYLGAIHQSGQHLLSLINDILDISRIENQAFELHSENMDIYAVLQDTIATLAPLASKKPVFLKLEGEAGLRAHCDHRAIRQCLLNIIGNAIKFSPADRIVSVMATTHIGGAVIKIIDQGPGIPDAIRDDLGKPFVRAAGPNLAGVEGTGLGIAITKALLKEQGGSIDFDSTPGKGTVVTIRLAPPVSLHLIETA
ncbi:PAS domain S-box protein [Oceanibaculum indicum]|uniref:histidine kinase n=1 Tax=Oceanibaculum indicum TaxID=526216 RepID=A0A420WI06_9PROT|nr:PAS domain S-box protein [Oceanibaculum indicum]RKQ70555.1 PAS domain S-box-containing protein [Oceanibaculum indicum]